VPVFTGKSRKQHDYLYWDYGHGRDKYSQAVRKGKWKAVRNGSGNPMELYDLTRDPGETADLSAKYPDVVSEMANRMEAAMEPSPDFPILDRQRPQPRTASTRVAG
jgi:arylsulfatase A-like enzyme